MKDLKEVLDKVATIINSHHKGEYSDINTLLEASRQLSTALYYLANERADYHKKYQQIVYDETREGLAVNKAENQAHVDVPEMYLLRQIMPAANTIIIEMGREVKQLQHEQNQNND